MAELAIALALMMQVEGIETDERLRSVRLKCLSPGALCDSVVTKLITKKAALRAVNMVETSTSWMTCRASVNRFYFDSPRVELSVLGINPSGTIRVITACRFT